MSPIIIPPKTPVWSVGTPITTEYIGSPIISIVIPKNVPIATFIIKNPTIAARPATPSPSDNPIATPTAKIKDKLLNIISPDCSITFATNWIHSALIKGAFTSKASFINKLPNANKSPAAGNKATGNISFLPILILLSLW